MIQAQFKNLRILGFNKSVLYSFMGRGWLLLGGLVTSFLIASNFSPELQGYYYAFNSLLTLTVFAELGLTSVLINFISHEWLDLRLDEKKTVLGDSNSVSRLISLCYFSKRWFMFAALFVIVALLIFGYFFWLDTNSSDIEWKLPWAALAIVTGLIMLFLPISSALEGCNQLVSLYKFRLIQYFVVSIVAWLAILLGADLWTASISSLAGLITISLLSWVNYGPFLSRIFFSKPNLDCINWQRDILPMQWRIALSWIGGYFTFALFVPVLFRYHGPVVAGQMGMTWAFIAALMSISSAWIAPHGPSFGLLVASKDFSELNKRFKNIFFVNTCLMLLGSLALLTAIILLNNLYPELGIRLLSPGITAIFLIGTVIYSMGLPIATYLRAHKQEPLTKISIIGGLLSGILVIIFGTKYGAMGIAIAYSASTIITLPFLFKVLVTKQKEWH
jgi:O-antigen/teichoic acid export membrane protein